MKEIERKWHHRTPLRVTLSKTKYSNIKQGYVHTDPELRVRDMDGLHFMTAKTDGTLRRVEVECSMTPKDFEAFWAETKGRTIEKRRYHYPLGGVTVEIDVFEGRHEGLVLLEIEFPSEEAAAAFKLPIEFDGAIEVTEDKRFKNKNLAVHGMQQIMQQISACPTCHASGGHHHPSCTAL